MLYIYSYMLYKYTYSAQTYGKSVFTVYGTIFFLFLQDTQKFRWTERCILQRTIIIFLQKIAVVEYRINQADAII